MPVQWLIGGALTLQTPGSSIALVWLMEMPKDVAVPSRTMQRQRGSVWTTPASTEQQEIPGSGALLEMKSMHGERVIITLEQPLPCAAALEKASATSTGSTTARLVVTEAIPIVRAAITELHEAMLKTLDGSVARFVWTLNEKGGRCCSDAGLLESYYTRKVVMLFQAPHGWLGIDGGESWWPLVAMSYLWKELLAYLCMNARVWLLEARLKAPATHSLIHSWLVVSFAL